MHTKDSVERAPQCILAAGGTARPDTGSTGDGFAWVHSLGHNVAPNRTTLVPVMLATAWTRALSGLTLPDVGVSLWSEGKK